MKNKKIIPSYDFVGNPGFSNAKMVLPNNLKRLAKIKRIIKNLK